MKQNRRNFLACIALTPVALLAAQSGKAADAACYDPAALSLSERNRRRSLGFAEASSDPKRRCGLCAFFVAGQGSCGNCQLMTGGRVTALGLCNSFAAKQG